MKRKSPCKWTKADVLRRALDFETRNAFGKGEFGAYMYARRHGFLDEACKHMRQIHRPPNYFADYERCKAEAAKYGTRTEFHLKSSSAYEHALLTGWLDEICSHMPPRKGAPRNYWNGETLSREAGKYFTRKQFKIAARGAWQAACRLGILDDVCRHMAVRKAEQPKPGKKPPIKVEQEQASRLPRLVVRWTREKCRMAALEFKTRTEFQNGAPSAYNRALKDGFLDDICQHMRPAGSRFRRALYAYEFNDRSVYVGLTFDYAQRHQQHLTDTRKKLWAKFQTTSFKLVKFNVWMDRQVAQEAEQKLVGKYAAEGWTILNRIRAGGLGGTVRKWFKNTCAREARKYHTRVAFIRGSSGAYDAAKNKGWLDDICAHMKRQRVRKWTREMLIAEAQKYSMLKDFREQAPGAYGVVCKKGWLNDICAHLKKRNEPKQKTAPTTAENRGGVAISKEARPTTDKTTARGGRIQTATRSRNYPKGGRSEKPKRPSPLYWTLDRLNAEAAKYQTRKEFKKRASGAYSAACKRKLLDEVCAHMVSLTQRRGYWDNKERVLDAAKKFETRAKFTKGNGSAYYAAIRNGWLDEACAHMRQGKTPNGTWTKQRLMQEARRFTTRKEFFRLASGAYDAAHRKGWRDEVCAHMPRRAKNKPRPATP
jgi:predicted GIY-YIG superfamily endonuclease